MRIWTFALDKKIWKETIVRLPHSLFEEAALSTIYPLDLPKSSRYDNFAKLAIHCHLVKNNSKI